MKWICCQIGARQHYAVPRALQRENRLAALLTDFWAGPIIRGLAGNWAHSGIRSLAKRFHPELDPTKQGKPKVETRGERHPTVNFQGSHLNSSISAVHSWNTRALWWEARLRRKAKTVGRYHGFIEVGHRFACAVRSRLSRDDLTSPDTIVFAYDTGALEIFERCRDWGMKCVLDQMDPNRVEVELVQAEEKRWPGWTTHPIAVPEDYFHRREREWALADRVVVNSRWSADALVQQGVPREKLFVMPLCYEVYDKHQKAENETRKSEKTLRVLFLGQVNLRKGIQYLMKAARLLEQENIHFDVVGPVGISAEAVGSAPPNLTFHGRATRDQTSAWYRQADLFVLPTLSDGFAITQVEAMSHSLPVITTPCCGEVVTEGMDGFIVPPGNADALAQTFLRYIAQPDLVRAQRRAATLKAIQFTLDRMAENLIKLEEEIGNRR
ncbi:MAG TPA: glycosyltransferase family 4 protein [Verrucomicrobiae bacterium]|nr:glycosyltransferase family 4 protein [Verrucomicrobiae bacterium]